MRQPAGAGGAATREPAAVRLATAGPGGRSQSGRHAGARVVWPGVPAWLELRVRAAVGVAMNMPRAASSLVIALALATTAASSIAPPVDVATDLVEIAAGPFTMGADPARNRDAYDNERWSAAGGEGTVFVPAFYIARHEVTVAEFAVFAAARTWTVDERALAGPPTHP